MKNKALNLAIIALLLSAAPASFAAAGKSARKNNASINSNHLSVTQIGSADAYVQLQIQLTNNGSKAARFTITDDNGTILYAENFRENHRTLAIKFLPEEVEKLVMVLKTDEGFTTKKFGVVTNTIYAPVVSQQ
jgi:hypothetical protein